MANKKKENPNREQSSPTEKTEKPTFAQELASWAVTIGAAVLIAVKHIATGSLELPGYPSPVIEILAIPEPQPVYHQDRVFKIDFITHVSPQQLNYF